MNRPRLAVHAAPPHDHAARAEAERLGLPFGDDPTSVAADLTLVLDERGWALRDGDGVTVRCDLGQGELGRRLRHGRAGERRLATALGLRRHPEPRVLDATAGLGRESVLAAALGCTVTACERDPAVALLLRDGLERAAADPALRDLVARIHLVDGDASEVLRALPAEKRPDVILVDPMFPERSGSALAKKEMQLLQRLLGTPEAGEVQDLLAVAVRYARRRVVCKRPPHALPVDIPRQPDLLLSGRASRYDVYILASPGDV